MPVCPSGSTLKAGISSTIHIDPVWIEQLLPAPLSWLVPYLPFMQTIDLDLAQLCSVEPPGYPTIDAADLIALVKPSRTSAALLAGQKLTQLVANVLWYQVCQCNAPDPAPVLPTGPSAPTGAPAINPPNVVTAPQAAPCFSATSSSVTYSSGNSLVRGGWALGVLPVTSIRFRITTAQVVAPGPSITWSVTQEDYRKSPVQTLASYAGVLAPGQSADVTLERAAAATHVYYYTNASATAGQTSESAIADFYCNGQLPGPLQGCGVDPRLLGLLEQIYALLQGVQRSYAPFAYIRGLTHASISGTGSFAVSRLIGLDVEVTDYPVSKPVLLGNPAYVKDLGWISVSEADGMIQEKRVAQLDFTWFPQLAPLATQVNYALQDGVELSVTELLPEP